MMRACSFRGAWCLTVEGRARPFFAVVVGDDALVVSWNPRPWNEPGKTGEAGNDVVAAAASSSSFSSEHQ